MAFLGKFELETDKKVVREYLEGLREDKLMKILQDLEQQKQKVSDSNKALLKENIVIRSILEDNLKMVLPDSVKIPPKREKTKKNSEKTPTDEEQKKVYVVKGMNSKKEVKYQVKGAEKNEGNKSEEKNGKEGNKQGKGKTSMFYIPKVLAA